MREMATTTTSRSTVCIDYPIFALPTNRTRFHPGHEYRSTYKMMGVPSMNDVWSGKYLVSTLGDLL